MLTLEDLVMLCAKMHLNHKGSQQEVRNIHCGLAKYAMNQNLCDTDTFYTLVNAKCNELVRIWNNR